MLSAHAVLQEIWKTFPGGDSYLSAQWETAGNFIGQPGEDDGFSQLPELFCSGLGGRAEQTTPLAVAWQLLRYAARLLDDIEDGARACNARDLNIATGLIFSAGRALNYLEKASVAPVTATAVRDDFYATLLQIAAGQHMDLTVERPSLDTAWQIASAKSGAFTGLICWASARLATDDAEQLALCRQIGSHIGLLDQIRDDLADLWSTDEAGGDLQRAHNWGLPAAYALAVLPEDEGNHLLQLLQAESGAQAQGVRERRARELIIQSGAALYLTVQATLTYNQAIEMVDALPVPQATRDHLQRLLAYLKPATYAATDAPS